VSSLVSHFSPLSATTEEGVFEGPASVTLIENRNSQSGGIVHILLMEGHDWTIGAESHILVGQCTHIAGILIRRAPARKYSFKGSKDRINHSPRAVPQSAPVEPEILSSALIQPVVTIRLAKVIRLNFLSEIEGYLHRCNAIH
jgi:hypothetical protein